MTGGFVGGWAGGPGWTGGPGDPPQQRGAAPLLSPPPGSPGFVPTLCAPGGGGDAGDPEQAENSGSLPGFPSSLSFSSVFLSFPLLSESRLFSPVFVCVPINTFGQNWNHTICTVLCLAYSTSLYEHFHIVTFSNNMVSMIVNSAKKLQKYNFQKVKNTTLIQIQDGRLARIDLILQRGSE